MSKQAEKQRQASEAMRMAFNNWLPTVPDIGALLDSYPAPVFEADYQHDTDAGRDLMRAAFASAGY